MNDDGEVISMIPDQRTRVEQVIAKMQMGVARSAASADNGNYAAVTLSIADVDTLLATLAACGTPQQEQKEVTRMGTKAEPTDNRTAPTVEVARTVHGGNVGADMVPFYISPGEHRPEYDQGDSVIVWYDDLYNLADRKDALLAALKGIREHCPADHDINPRWNAAWDALLDALAKAEGSA